MSIYSEDPTQIGNYTITVMVKPIQAQNETNTSQHIEIQITIKGPKQAKEKLVKPYLKPAPDDLSFIAGDFFTYSFGRISGSHHNLAYLVVDWGDADSFITWEPQARTFTVQANDTSSDDIGVYEISLTIEFVSNKADFDESITYKFKLEILAESQEVKEDTEISDEIADVFCVEKNKNIAYVSSETTQF